MQCQIVILQVPVQGDVDSWYIYMKSAVWFSDPPFGIAANKRIFLGGGGWF